MTSAHLPRLVTKSELFRLNGDNRTGCKGLACGFRTAPLTLAHNREQQLCISSVTQSIGIHLYYTFSRAVSQNNSLSIFKIYLLANQKNSLQDTWLLPKIFLRMWLSLISHHSLLRLSVTGNLWICCHCQVRVCYSPSWESEPTLPPEGTPLHCNDPPGCETCWLGCGEVCPNRPGAQLKALPHQRGGIWAGF